MAHDDARLAPLILQRRPGRQEMPGAQSDALARELDLYGLDRGALQLGGAHAGIPLGLFCPRLYAVSPSLPSILTVCSNQRKAVRAGYPAKPSSSTSAPSSTRMTPIARSIQWLQRRSRSRTRGWPRVQARNENQAPVATTIQAPRPRRSAAEAPALSTAVHSATKNSIAFALSALVRKPTAKSRFAARTGAAAVTAAGRARSAFQPIHSSSTAPA